MPFKSLKSFIHSKKNQKGSKQSSSQASTSSQECSAQTASTSEHSLHSESSRDSLAESSNSQNNSESCSLSLSSESSLECTTASENLPESRVPTTNTESTSPNGEPSLSRRHSLESSVNTLMIADDSSSTANTLIPGAEGDDASVFTRVGSNNTGPRQPVVNSTSGATGRNIFRLGRRNQDDNSGWFYDDDHSKTLPIYSTRFKSGAHVYESDLAAKVSRTLLKRKQSSFSSAPSRSSKDQTEGYLQGLTGRYKGKGKIRKNSATAESSSSSLASNQSQASSSNPAAHAGTSSSQEKKEAPGTDEIPTPPSIACTPHTCYNPFGKARSLFMTIYKYGGVPKRQTLLGRLVFQRHQEIGIIPTSEDFISPGGVPVSPEALNSHEKVAICKVWQEVIHGSNGIVKYDIEFENPLDFEQPVINMVNDGRKRVTDASYNGIRMRWYGTTGLGSTFGSGFFELRFVEKPCAVTPQAFNPAGDNVSANPQSGSVNSGSSSSASNINPVRRQTSNASTNSGSSSSSNSGGGSPSPATRNMEWEQIARQRQEQMDTERRRPPVALYHNISSKTLSATRKVGEFTIWEPGYELADIIVIMGLVLREQEQRKDVEYQHIVSSIMLQAV